LFTHSLLLWFLPLAALPIVLHVITLYRLRTVELSTFRFLMDSYRKQRRRVRLIEWLVLLLRTLLVALIVFILARPTVQQFGYLFAGGHQDEVLIIVDAGASMAATHAGRSRMDRARDAARGVLDMLPPDQRVTLVRAGRSAKVLSRGTTETTPSLYSDAAAIKPDAAPADIAAALDAGQDTLGRTPDTLYVITDGSTRAWSRVAGHALWQQRRGTGQVVLMHVGPRDVPANVAIVGQPPVARRPVVGLPITLQARVANPSGGRTADTVLTTIIDGERVAETPMTIAADQSRTATVTFTPRRAGLIEGRFETPGDAFTADDTFVFSLNVEPRFNVLLVSGSTPTDASIAARADDAGFFIATALTTPLRVSAGSAAERQIAASLAITRASADALSPADLAQADAVVLADARIDVERGGMLRRYVEEGGGLLVIPGPNLDPGAINDFLLGSAFAPASRLLPTFGQPTGHVDDESSFTPILMPDVEHDVLRPLRDSEASYFGTTRVYRRWPIELPDRDGGDAPTSVLDASTVQPLVLLRDADGSAMLVDVGFGRGRMMLAGFAATPRWSNLPLKPVFVPLMLRSVAYLRRLAPVSTPTHIAPGEPAVVRVADHWPNATVQIRTSDEHESVVELMRSEQGREGAWLGAERKGHYRFIIQPHDADAPQRVQMGFAVNLDTDATDLTSLDETALRRAVAPVDPVVLRASADDPLMMAQLTRKSELWRWLIGLAFVVIAVEFVLSTLTSREPDEPTSGSPMDENSGASRRGLRQLLASVGWGEMQPAGRSRQ